LFIVSPCINNFELAGLTMHAFLFVPGIFVFDDFHKYFQMMDAHDLQILPPNNRKGQESPVQEEQNCIFSGV
jgi:hypothetical protein